MLRPALPNHVLWFDLLFSSSCYSSPTAAQQPTAAKTINLSPIFLCDFLCALCDYVFLFHFASEILKFHTQSAALNTPERRSTDAQRFYLIFINHY